MADFKRVKDDVQVAMATDSPNKGLHDSSRVHVSPLERTALMQRRRTRRNRSWRNKYSIQVPPPSSVYVSFCSVSWRRRWWIIHEVAYVLRLLWLHIPLCSMSWYE